MDDQDINVVNAGSGTTSQQAAPTAPEGVRARRALAMKNLIPDQDWINKNVVAGGKGTQGLVGRIFGVATSTETKDTVLPDGTPSQTIAVKGSFQAESYLTGEITEATLVYFPRVYAEKIVTVFAVDENVKVVEVDCDIGLEATGKTIPYEWVVIAYREGEAMAVLKRIRASRARPTNLLGNGIMGGVGQPVLTAPNAAQLPSPDATPNEVASDKPKK